MVVLVTWFRQGASRILRILPLLALLCAMPLHAASDQQRQAAWNQIDQQMEAFFADLKSAASAGDRPGVKQVSQRRQAIVGQAAALYRERADDAVAMQAMLLVLHESRDRSLSLEICRNLIKYHLNDASLYQTFPIITSSLAHFDNSCEQLLLKAAKQSGNEKVRDAANLRLAGIYMRMSKLLANMAELDMSIEQYTMSKARGSFGRLSEQDAKKISSPLCKSSWLNRDWQQLRLKALKLAEQVLDSEQELDFYKPPHSHSKRDYLLSVSEEAETLRYQLQHSAPGTKLAGFNFRNLQGEPVSLQDHSGKVLLIDVWATWCPPCVTGLKQLEPMSQEMAGRPFSLITISIDRDMEKVRQFAANNSMPFENWYVGDNPDFFDQWGVDNIPTKIVVDANGMVRSIPRVGYKDLLNYIDRLVSEVEQ